MNANTNMSLSRRAVLQGAGALVISFSVTDPTKLMAQIADGKPALLPTELDSWLALGKDGGVTVFFGKIDGGQGTDLCVGQMVAEELDVPISKVTVVQGDTGQTVNQGGASGSTGIKAGGVALRQAGAEARRVLVNRAAEKLGVAADRLTVTDGVVSVIGDASKKISYAEIIDGGYFRSEIGWNKVYGNGLTLTSPAKLKSPDQYKVVGTSPPRTDVHGKVFGITPWASDIRVVGMLHGRIIRPNPPGAKIVSIDETSIADIPGARVLRKAEFIGVVAPREWDAIKASRQLKVTWSEVGDPFVDMAGIYDHIRNAPVTKMDKKDTGEVDANFAKAAKIVDVEYEWPFQSHASMGPGCAVADVKPEGVTVWTGTQKPHYTAQGVALLLGVPVEKVRAIWVTGPGSYGRNDAEDATCDAALLSQMTGKPVRVQYMRDEGTGWDPKGPASIHRGRAALDASGNVLAIEFISKGFSRTETNTNISDPGDTLAGMLTGLDGKRVQVFGTPDNEYTFENTRFGWETIAPLLGGPSPLRTSHLRDPLGPQIAFANESFIDEVAFAAEADPIEFRLRYLKEPRDRAVLQAAAEKAGWRPGKAGTRRSQNGDIVTGRGVAYSRRDDTIVALIADVEINERTGAIRVPRMTVAHDCGLIINPDALKRVIEANICQGLSRAIHEEVQFDKRSVKSVDWVTYPILDITEAPPVIDIVLINHPELPPTGAGEPSMRPLAAAVNNAIFEATGTRLRRAPLTPQRIRAAGV